MISTTTMTSFVRLLVVALIFVNGSVVAQDLLSNTGKFLFPGSYDLYWDIVTPDSTVMDAIIMDRNKKWQDSSQNLLNSFQPTGWIGIRRSGDLDAPRGKYVYRHHFWSKNYEPLTGYFFADNRVESIIIAEPAKKFGGFNILQTITDFPGGNRYWGPWPGGASYFTINSFGKTSTILLVTVVNDGGPSGLLLWFSKPVSPPSKVPTAKPSSPKPTFTAVPTAAPTRNYLITNGLAAHYSATNFEEVKGGNARWCAVNNNLHCSVFIFGGPIQRNIDPKDGRVYIRGPYYTKIEFAIAEMPRSNYTIFHRARYDGVNKERIFTSSDDINNLDFFSGFNEGNTGVAYHYGWITNENNQVNPMGWLISVDQWDLYRANKQSYTVRRPGQPYNFKFGMNTKSRFTSSDWAVSDVLIYHRKLTLEEIRIVEEYLER